MDSHQAFHEMRQREARYAELNDRLARNGAEIERACKEAHKSATATALKRLREQLDHLEPEAAQIRAEMKALRK